MLLLLFAASTLLCRGRSLGALLGGWACAWVLLLAPQAVQADEPPPASAVQVAPRESYEQQRLERVLIDQKLALEPVPEGKRIAFIRFVRDDVFVEDEIWPLWFNWFHGRTRERIIRRELLFEEGGSYRDARIEETMRNLRGMGIFAMARIVAVKGSRPDEVGILVHTRDLWSLRPETNFSSSGKVLNSFLLRLTEINFLGLNRAPSVDYLLAPKTYELAEGFYTRRVFLSSVTLSQRAGLVFNRRSNKQEGQFATLNVGQPFFRLSQRFAWDANWNYDRRIARALKNGHIVRFSEDPDNPDAPSAPWVFRRRSQQIYGKAGYRLGDQWKSTFSLGWDYRSLRTWIIRQTELPEELRSAFVREAMPLNRTDNGPTFSYEFFLTEWATFVNLATYGMSENVRTGPHFLFTSRVPLRAAGSTANAWVVSAEAGLVLAPRGFLIDLKAYGLARLQQGRWIDQRQLFQVRGATPVFSIFRFVVRSYLELRRRDSQNTLVTLGADNGLRGYPAQAFRVRGGDRFLANFELRTLPIQWEAVQVGGVLFYDVGAVFQHFADVRPYHSVGVGVRLLFPQANRTPFSFDGGMSFDPRFQFMPNTGAGQPIPLTAAEDAQ